MQIILKLTTACNLNCVYCSEGDVAPKTLPKEIFFKLIDEFPPVLERAHTRDAEFLFHGGEPMLYGRENLKTLMDYAREKLQGFNVRFLMQTNGTLIDEDWAEFFKAENISVGVSLDGYPEIHDKNRRDKNGEPTAEKILRNLRLMNDAGVHFGTLMVLNSPEDVDADKLFDFIRENDFQPKIHPVIPCGRAAGREDTPEVYDAWVEVMKQLFKKSLAEDVPKIIQPLDETMDAILGVADLRECSFSGNCAESFMSLYPDGEVGFCGRNNLARRLVYGNLNEKTLLELYDSDNAKKIRGRKEYLQAHDCKGCKEWKLCRGGCAFEAVNSAGTIHAKYLNCEPRRKFIAWLRTEGLKLLKAAYVREKTLRRNAMKTKKEILREIDSWEVGTAAENGT